MNETTKIMDRLNIINHDIENLELCIKDDFLNFCDLINSQDTTTNAIINFANDGLSGFYRDLNTDINDLKELQHEKSELEYFLK